METFNIINYTFTYAGRSTPALSGLNLKVELGEFIVLCGKSGSGKSTLLKNLKTPLAPNGSSSGEILFYGRLIDTVSFREQAQRIGYVLQDPENQIVTDKVWHELAFGLENLGYDPKVIRLRVAEMASYFGIQTWFRDDVASLSGGQKQMLNLAAIMAMQPDVLILDEPTAQLDPIAATEFLETIRKINRDIGVTVIISEHRLEEVFPMADRAVILEDGAVICDAPPREAGLALAMSNHDMFMSMPTPVQVFSGIQSSAAGVSFVRQLGGNRTGGIVMRKPGGEETDWIDIRQPGEEKTCGIDVRQPCGEETDRIVMRQPGEEKTGGIDMSGNPYPGNTAPPITVREGREWLTDLFKDTELKKTKCEGGFISGDEKDRYKAPAVKVVDVWFRYERGDNDAVKDFSLEVQKNKFTCIVGGNATGKSTALKLIAGLRKPQRGKILINGRDITRGADTGTASRISLLPQNPQTLFVERTLELDLLEHADKKESDRITDIVAVMELGSVLDRHPYDLSGGEQQRAALAKVLLTNPDILLLDEPTKGMDSHFKAKFYDILRGLLGQGKTVLAVSHDVEFCARYADVCALFFDGGVVTVNQPRAFFSGNSYYTTAANRMSRHIFEGAITSEDVIEMCEMNLEVRKKDRSFAKILVGV